MGIAIPGAKAIIQRMLLLALGSQDVIHLNLACDPRGKSSSKRAVTSVNQTTAEQ